MAEIIGIIRYDCLFPMSRR